MKDKEHKKLRSQEWFAPSGGGKGGFVHRKAWRKNQGLPADTYGKPVIGICNTWSELSPCNTHLRDLAESVKRGVLEADGYPLEFPIMSTGESIIKPTAMLFRNLMSMDAEESIGSNPLDGVVLLTGCDKTTPATIMGAASVDIPTIVVPGGAMLNGRFRGKNIGNGTYVWKLKEKINSGELTEDDLKDAEVCSARSEGHCTTMGTASSMACMAEALGLTLPGAAAIPAVDARKKVMAQLSGRQIVDMVKADLKMSNILTRKAFENAIIINAAIGGSTNFIVHLQAIAGRMGVELNLQDFDDLGSKIPLLVNLMPSGKYLMEEFYDAGGLPVVLNYMKEHLHNDVITVNGKTLGENNANAICFREDVIYKPSEPLQKEAGIAVLKGNLCKNGAVIKPSAATESLLVHTGKAVVFENMNDFRNKIDDPDLDIDENSVMVLKNVGPVGFPGMPEVGNLDLPKKVLEKGFKDMVRISDGRMSGTAFGTVVLHVSPESAVGGNLALVENGDLIILDVPNRKLNVDISDEELQRRREKWVAPESKAKRGYPNLYVNTVEQAHLGVDLDFLVGNSKDN
ncbi:IlvD/Edd family dehydratase [Seonamhaeicola maritimus]|uniref:Dihydroxy-acid dehydratase n=1 Tax=Seonamhaeicola maritimus TaxID=2591822 RepID=A0A5C7GE87_9FLAO|nr:IlvD/Edd family dehydratase [Seonamhaeicola maritimus]TXG34691.1 dihydroxy-acid dehydratase [Seonamhaeicola maritimus]